MEAQAVNRPLLGFANSLTIGRLLGTPLLIYYLLQTPTQPSYNRICLILVVILQLSDILDGYIARRAKGKAKVHTLGEILDPIADKLYINSAFITLVVIDRVPLWVGGLIVLRDVLILTGWLTRYLSTGDRILPNAIGKTADSSQSLLVILVLAQPATAILTAMEWIAVGLTVLSGFVYLRVAIEGQREPEA